MLSPTLYTESKNENEYITNCLKVNDLKILAY